MEWKKFKQLTLKQKIEWLLEYYGLKVIIGIIIAVVLVIFIRSVFFPEEVSDVCVLILADGINQDTADELQKTIEEETGHSAYVVGCEESDVYGKQAFSVRITAEELDIIVAPEEETAGMISSGYLPSPEPIERTSLYIGKTYRAREGELTDKTYDIVYGFVQDHAK